MAPDIPSEVAAVGKAPSGDSTVADTPYLVLPLKDVDYFFDFSPGGRVYACGGLLALGDANGDGFTDIVVALHRKSSGPTAEQSWIEVSKKCHTILGERRTFRGDWVLRLRGCSTSPSS